MLPESVQARRRREARARRLQSDPTLAPHGEVTTYRNWLCRCAECVEANKQDCSRRWAGRKRKRAQ